MGSPGSCLKPANSGIWTLQDAASIVYPPCSEAQASERRNAEPVDGLPCLLLDRACNVTTSDPHSDAAVERAISVDHIGRGDVIHLSKAFCKCLVAASVLPGEVVTICMPNAAELVPVFLGTALARAIAAPLDSACTAHEFEQSNTASRSRAVVLFAGDVRTQELQYLARKIGLSVCSVKLEIEHQSMDGNAAHRLQASWLSRAEPCLPAENNGVSSGIHPTDRLCSEDDVALLLHMPSAMSGELKMERVTHGQLVRHAVRLAALYDLTTHDTTMLLMPFSHAGGLVATFLASFVAGCPVLVPRLADAPSLFSLIARHRISWYAAAPALHHMLLEQAEAHPEQLWPAGQLRFVCSIGGSLDAAQMARMNALLRARVVTLPSQCAGLLQPPEASTQVAVPVDAAGNERPHPSHAHVAGNPAARVSSACRGLDTHSSGRTTLTEEAAANVEKDPLGCPAEQLGGQVGPRDVLEARLQEIVQDLLGASQTVSVLANFFHFGMSLAATVRLASVIRQQFRDVIPGADCMQVATVLTHASIAELAEALRQGCGTRPALASEQTQSIHHGQPSPRSHSSPVSFGQDQMLALHELDPTSPAYNMSIWWSVAGHVDVDRLRRSIQVVVGRHDVLRYIFASNPDVPPGHMGAGCQLAVPAADFTVPCEVWDCRREPGEAGQAKDALLQTWAARPFDLYSGPLLRVLLLIKSDVAASLVQGSSTSKVDVSLVLTGDPGSADQLLLLEYRTDLWCEASMQRLGQQLVCLASSAVASPETPVGRLPMMTEAERRRVVEEWNATDTAFACAGKCLHELFDEQVSRTPDHVAVETETEHVTYREVQQRADALACCLRDAGVVVDGRVGLCLKGCAEMVVGMLAILKAGCAYVPLDPEYPAERVQGMLEDADVSILLTSPHQQPPWGADTFGHLKQLEVPLTPAYAPDLPAQKRVIHRKVFPTDLAYVLFTSGTTGRPKGVMVEHYNVCNLVACVIDRWQLDSSSRVLQLANPSFDASVAEVFGTLAAGGTLVVHPVGSDLQDSLRRVTCAFAVPSVLSMFNPAHFPGLSTICTGGEMVPLHMATSWAAGRRCLIGYGPTECCVMVTMGQMTAEDQSVSIGGPLPNVRAYVLDAYLQPTNIGVPGELYIGGAGVARGYANRNDLTKEKFLDNPFAAGRLYRTGDLARWLPDGRLQCLGRLDRQVKLSGVRIELGEVEGVLEACPGVAKAVAILQDVRGRADGPVSSSKRLVAYVAPANVQVDALVEAARRKLPSYMVPSAVVALERFPVTISGKVDLRALPPVDLSTSGGRAYVPPRSVYEARVQAVCQDVLGVASLSVLASFHEFGINSLMAMALVHQMRERLAEFPGAGEGLRVTTVLANPSVAELAAVMTCGRQVATRPADMAARCQEEALSFSQLDGAAGLLSAALAASGVGAEMRVAIVMERSLLLLAAMLGVLKAGACYVSLDPANPPAYLASLLDAASITAILWDRAVCGRLQGMAGLEQTTCFVVDDLVADARTASGTGGGRGLNQDFSVGPFIHADQAAVCLFSSGSSGVPKGVELTHRALVAKLEGYWAACPFRLGEACLARTTVSFVDHTLEILGSLLHGVPVVLATAQEARDPASLLHVVASAHITRLVVVPSLLQAMLADTQEDERVRAMWREGLLSLVISSGEPLPLSLAQAFLAAAGDHCQLVNLYGSTETCGDATWAPVTRAMVAAGHVTVGHPLLRAVTLVLDDHGQLAPPGVPGELCVGGGVVARGYLHQPELTASRFTRIPIGDLLGGDAAALPASRFPQHPVSDMFTPSPDEAASGKDDRPSLVLYRTGDCARLLPCGDLALMGRLDHQVKVRGVRLELGFVEQAMARLPGVAAAGAVLVPATQQGLADAAGHDTLVAVVSPRRLLPEALLAALGQQLPQYALPARILCEDELPRLISGKLDRRKLLAMAAAEMAEMRRVGTGGGGREAPTSHAAVRMDPLEAKLAALWGKVLRLPSVSVFDDFFNIGGNSLVAVQLQRELAREMVRDPALAPLASGDRHLSVFSHRTISSMAAEAASALGRTAGRGASGTSDNRHAFRGAAAAASLMFRPQSLFACLLGPASSSSGAEPATSGEEHALSGVLEVVTSNLRFLWSFSVVMLHFGHCGGQNLRCFQNTPLAGLWAPHDNTSLANFVPRAFQGGVLGLSILSGMGAASGGMRPSLRTPVLAVILALLMEFGVSRAFDDLVRSSPQERFSTTAHLWGLWALAFNQLLLWLCVGLWRSHTRREGPSYRNGGVVLLLLAAGTMQFLLPILFALLWPPASAAGVRGMWFGPWGMHQLGWEPLGPRILTSALPFAIGYAYNSQITRLVHTGRSHVWLRVALAAIFVQLTVRSTFFPDILAGLDLRSSEAARFATVADVMATWELGLWWREWPLRVLGCMGALAEDMVMAFAMLAIMPALDGTVTRFGRASLPIYLFHPHVLRLMEPFSFWLLRQVSSNMPLTVMLEVLLPLSSTVCLCLAFAAMQRRGLGIGKTVIGLSIVLHVLKRALV
eukprot:jgi/Mesvir1/5862/Mv00649-RA.2